MYSTGEEVRSGDVVEGMRGEGEGEVLEVSGGKATVQWHRIFEQAPGYRRLRAPVIVHIKEELKFVRRKA